MLSDKYISSAEAGEILDLSHFQISYLCRKNILAGAEKIGKMWLIPRDSVEVYKYLKRKKRK